MERVLTWLETHKDWTIEFLRMYLGLILILKGFVFIRDMDQLLGLIGLKNSLWLGGLFAHYIVLVHLLGGAFFLIGLITRVVAGFQILIVAAGIFVVYAKEGLLSGTSNLEYTTFVFLGLVAFLFYGGGRLSVDHLLERKRE